MQKQKGQVRQPVTMVVLIAALLLSELPSFSALINSSSPSAIPEKPVSTLVAETTGNTDDRPPSNFVIIPVIGNVYPNGFYYVSIKIGDPPKPYFLDIDTGSDVTWLPKGPYPLYEPNPSRHVPCNDLRCTAVHISSSENGKCKNTEPCEYEIDYQDKSSSKGYLVTDTFALFLKNGSSIRPTLAIGYDAHDSPTAPDSHSTTHGMLGLGRGKISILSQLGERGLFNNIFGHCLSSKPNVLGFMFIGKYFYHSRCLTWVPMSSDVLHSLRVDEVVYGDKQLLGRNQAFILDSGTTYTYFLDPLYHHLLSEVRKARLQYVPGDENYPHCWKGTKPFNSIHEIRSYFPTVKLKLREGLALEIPPDNYFIITEAGNACLGIFNALEAGLDDNVIGAISMQDVMVVYDNEQQQIGWARVAGCNQPPVSICAP